MFRKVNKNITIPYFYEFLDKICDKIKEIKEGELIFEGNEVFKKIRKIRNRRKKIWIFLKR